MKIKVPFSVPSKDFLKSESIMLPVESNYVEGGEFHSNQEWRVVLPDFMFNEVADTESQFKTIYDVNNSNVFGCFSRDSLTQKFKKTQVSTSIDILQNCFSCLTLIILNRHSVERKTQKKVIFVKFKSKEGHILYNMNHAYMGVENSHIFNYFIGYEILSRKYMSLDLKLKKGEDYLEKVYFTKTGLTSLNNSIKAMNVITENFVEKDDLFLLLDKKIESEYKIIDWTQERENFCLKMQTSFSNLNQKLSDFFANMDNDRIDLIISNSKFSKLLSE